MEVADLQLAGPRAASRSKLLSERRRKTSIHMARPITGLKTLVIPVGRTCLVQPTVDLCYMPASDSTSRLFLTTFETTCGRGQLDKRKEMVVAIVESASVTMTSVA